MNLNDIEIRYQVIVNGKVVAQHLNNVQANLFFETLNESEKSNARIVPVTNDGNQVLLG